MAARTKKLVFVAYNLPSNHSISSTTVEKSIFAKLAELQLLGSGSPAKQATGSSESSSKTGQEAGAAAEPAKKKASPKAGKKKKSPKSKAKQ